MKSRKDFSSAMRAMGFIAAAAWTVGCVSDPVLSQAPFSRESSLSDPGGTPRDPAGDPSTGTGTGSGSGGSASGGSGTGGSGSGGSGSGSGGSMPPVVCNPLGDQQVGSSQNGLSGDLYYVPGTASSTEKASFTRLDKFFTDGVKANLTLVLSQLNVPTRAWTDGFAIGDGEYLEDGSGAKLQERFALRLSTQVQLGASDAPGLYQFATLSDDGSRVTVGSPGESASLDSVLINASGEQATRMNCASSAVSLAAGEKRPMRVEYFQGPREHIALVLMWRKVGSTSGSALADPLCGVAGSDKFFRNGVGTSDYQALLSRGWKVLAPGNFQLSTEAPENTCNDAPK